MAVQERLALRCNLIEAKWGDRLLSSGQSYNIGRKLPEADLCPTVLV
jgi:hypothetical protein